jgi:hypothetical protein
MTKKHFIMAAKIIAAMPAHKRREHAESWVKVCVANNPRFNKEKFFAACGI